MTHITGLEDTVIALSDSEDSTVEYKKARRIASNIKRKRLHQKSKDESDSENSIEQPKRRVSPRFQKQNKQQATRYYTLERKEMDIEKTTDQDETAEGSTQSNE